MTQITQRAVGSMASPSAPSAKSAVRFLRAICGSQSLFPFEVSALPGPDEAFGEEKNEYQHHDQRAGGQVAESDGEGQQEEHLDIEDQEENRVEIIVRLELDPRVAGRSDAALIDVVLDRAGLGGLEEFEPEA